MYFADNKFQVFALHIWFLRLVLMTHGAVMAPPWANPKLNPCATQPRGWQLLYWPPDGRCYKIFQRGYPCPGDMELSPATSTSSKQTFSAECRCPPMTAQSIEDGKCYELFTTGPCEKGLYFAPDINYNNSTIKRRLGICKAIGNCSNPNEIFWPQSGRCYMRLTRGPCPKGQLLTLGPNNLAVCKCNHRAEMEEYWSSGNGCFQHFTKGPCKEEGHLFLPNRQCGCHEHLPHFHEGSKRCYEIGAIGPCNLGETFQLDPNTGRGICACKTGHIRHVNDFNCYRPYTQGPCSPGHILVNTTTCIRQPCDRGHLYFPEYERCYRVGTRGPCEPGKLVSFDFETRPSIDGLSYNGLCRCKDINCDEDEDRVQCENNEIFYENRCYKLYMQGPCAKGAWLVPKRHHKEEIWTESRRKWGMCDCMPGYTRSLKITDGKNSTECISPTVIIAEYLNKNFFSMQKEWNSTNPVQV